MPRGLGFCLFHGAGFTGLCFFFPFKEAIHMDLSKGLKHNAV